MTIHGSSNLPVAPKATKWDAPAAKRRVFEACNGNVACIGRAFLLRGEGDARLPEAWSMGFADYIDGQLHIIPKGIAACAGARGVGTFSGQASEAALLRARISSVYDRVRREVGDWPEPAWAITADASGTPIEGAVAIEGLQTGDRRFIEPGALRWDEGPIPVVFDIDEMDHSGATVGTINSMERREGGVIWGVGNLSASENPDVAALALRAEELFAEGAVGVSVSLDDMESDLLDEDGKVIDTSGDVEQDIDWEKVVTRVTAARIRSVAIVDEAAFSPAKMAIAAAVRPVRVTKTEHFVDPGFGNGSKKHDDDGGDDRLVWQEPEHPEDIGQFGCPLKVHDDGQIYGHAALWYRCHVGYQGTCVRPPREPAAYKGYLTGDRTGTGIPTGPMVFRTTHAKLHLKPEAASIHYDHTGAAPADVTIGADAYGIWVAGALRLDATQADIEMLRASAASGDWRPMPNGMLRLIGILAVSGPGFRVARAMAASGALITIGPGCTICDDDEVSLEERVERLETLLASGMVSDCA